jgi:ribosomal protein S12 methylthiotransferase accessory factor YcaO
MVQPDVVRKDAPAEQTIERIRAALDRLGFFRERLVVHRWSASEACHSCHIRFASFPLIFANGKGVTEELALASALAEFMERLQCRADALFTRAGHIACLAPFAPRREVELGPDLDLPELARLPRRLSCLEFVDVFGRRVVDLPYDAFEAMTGSSGMCAGNTPEEAIAHGLCEVFERHVIHGLESGEVRGLPTLPADALPVRSRVVRRQLDALASAGFDVAVKDATLGGRFPVVGLVVADRAAGTCHVSFGSDPVFDAALSRCITEAFQGTGRLFRPRPAPGGIRPLDTYNNLEVLLDRVERSVGPPCVERAFGEAADSRQALAFAVRRVRELGRRLYVRDFGIFGFPAYYVYVEELSALKALGPEAFSFLHAHVEAVRRAIFGLPHASGEEIARCARVLVDEMERCTPMLDATVVSSVLHAPVSQPLSPRALLVLMLLEAGDLEKAGAVLNRPPAAPPVLEPPLSAADVARWIPSYAAERRAAIGRDLLAARFAEAFGEAHVGSDHESVPPLPVPRCQSVYACPSCPCRTRCSIEEWCRLARRLRAEAAPVRQEALLERLEP